MKNFLIAFFVFLVWSVFGLWLYSWMQDDKETSISKLNISKSEVIDDSEAVVSDSLEIVTIDIQDQIDANNESDDQSDVNGLEAINIQGDYIFLYSEGISTKLNSTDITIPLSIIDFKYKLYTYLIEHPDQELHIHSIYSPVENLVSPNLGIQRGEKMKEILIEVGIPNERILIKPIIKSIDTNQNEWTKNIMYFTFKPFNEKRLEEIPSIPKSKIIYPRYSDFGILENDELKNLLLEVKNNLNRNPGLKIEIVGHTDNVGNGIDNYRMGLKYARQVRWYLINKGDLIPEQIIATSRGEEEPMVPNEKNKNILSNRRIEVIYF